MPTTCLYKVWDKKQGTFAPATLACGWSINLRRSRDLNLSGQNVNRYSHSNVKFHSMALVWKNGNKDKGTVREHCPRTLFCPLAEICKHYVFELGFEWTARGACRSHKELSSDTAAVIPTVWLLYALVRA